MLSIWSYGYNECFVSKMLTIENRKDYPFYMMRVATFSLFWVKITDNFPLQMILITSWNIFSLYLRLYIYHYYHYYSIIIFITLTLRNRKCDRIPLILFENFSATLNYLTPPTATKWCNAYSVLDCILSYYRNSTISYQITRY